MRLFKNLAKSALERCGYEVSKTASGFSHSPFFVFRQLFRKKTPGCVFDVGGHHGETAAKLASLFPETNIHSFEPSPESFSILQRNLRKFPRVIPVHLAFGDREEERVLHQNRFSPTNSLLNNAINFSENSIAKLMEPVSEVAIPVRTLDGYCRDNKIAFVDFLKIDVQGFELHVLRGAAGLLSEEKVAVVHTEVLFEELYEGQAFFHEVYAHLTGAGFQLNNLFEQSHSTRHVLRWCDALFIHPSRYERFLNSI
jgi:FkbM family methyltransferase